MLTGLKPFPQLNSAKLVMLMKDLVNEPYKSGMKVLLESLNDFSQLPVEYLYIHDKLTSVGASQQMISFLLMLLDVNEHTRLGSKKAGGVTVLKEHPVFRWCLQDMSNVYGHPTYQMVQGVVSTKSNATNESVANNGTSTPVPVTDTLTSNNVAGDTPANQASSHTAADTKNFEYCWEYIDNKILIPPFIPPTEIEEHHEIPLYSSFSEMMHVNEKSIWLNQYTSTYYDSYFQNW